MYCSRNDGETASTLATLSNPSASSSLGSSAPASIATPSNSSMAFAYSARFNRCSATRPGSGRSMAARSSDRSSQLDEAVHAGLIGTPRAGRRHQSPAQLADGFLPELLVAREPVEIERIEHHPGGLAALVMAADAVLIEQGTLGRHRFGSGCRALSGARSTAVAEGRPAQRGGEHRHGDDASSSSPHTTPPTSRTWSHRLR